MMAQQRLTLISLGLVLWLALAWAAQAEMLVSPTRAFMDEDNRSATLTLRNTGDGARTYRLEWEDKRMTESGRYVAIGEGEQWPSAASMVRHSPRQITVGPGENQTVRLSYRPPEDLEPGEYRSHLRLQVMSDVSEPVDTLESEVSEDEGIGFRLFMQMSFSVPVVVRHGIEAPEVRFSNIEAVPSEEGRGMGLGVTLERTGQASSFGRILVEMQRDSESPVETIGRRREVSIFHEMDKRRMSIPLRDESIPPGSWVRVVYEGRQEYDGLVWDERTFRTE